jgi:hypothetical protein
VDAEQIHSEFSPGEEYSTNNQPEEQQPEVISSPKTKTFL